MFFCISAFVNLFTIMKNIVLIFSCLAILSLFSACEEEGPILPIELSISPSASNAIPPGKTLLFTANASVEWEVPDTEGGSITQDGVYTAPNTVGTYTILAVSKEDPTVTATYRVYVTFYHEFFSLLKGGGYVLYFRHTEANVGVDKLTPHGEWYKTCNADSARQLSLVGKVDAAKIGSVLKGLEIPVDSAVASEFCRCKKTVDFMGMDLKVNRATNLTFFVYGEFQRHERTLKTIGRQKVGSGHNMIVSAHSYAQGSTFPSINQGDLDIFVPKGEGNEPEYIGRIPITAFRELHLE